MDRFKFFLERYQKEFIVVVVIIFMIGSVGIYLLCKKNSSSEFLLSSAKDIEKIEEQEVEDKEDYEMRIDIKGEVQNPGVYIATDGMRVIDIIEMAGGLTKTADTSVNNLSRKVSDEMVIKIYSKKEVEKFSEIKDKEEDIVKRSQTIIEGLRNDGVLKEDDILPNHSEADLDSKNFSDHSNSDMDNNQEDLTEVQKISINTATKEELLSLKGIGESKAAAIITYRNEHGKFERIEDIMLVSGIGESVFEKIKEFITI